MALNFLILGHSFAKRLSRWCCHNSLYNLNLDNKRIQIFWHGVGGATVSNPHHHKSLWSEIHLVSDLNVKVTVLDIGSNDLCNHDASAVSVASHIVSLAEAILLKGCDMVVIFEILQRQSQPAFNAKVQETNQILSDKCSNHQNLIFWSHSRNNFNIRFLRDYVDKDGIHVDYVRGMPRYYTSVRGACLLAEQFHGTLS